jgi:hypothetical protein
VTNPNKANLAAPIPITFQLRQDPNIIITSHGASQDVAVVTSLAHPPLLWVGTIGVLGQTTSVLSFPNVIVVNQTLQPTPQLPPVITSLPLIVGHTELVIPSERQVFLEVLKPDGTLHERIVLDESILDGNLEVIRKLPDGNYRFQVQEPGEVRQRMILEFQVRQGRIVDRTEELYRPRSASPINGREPEEQAPGVLRPDNAEAELDPAIIEAPDPAATRERPSDSESMSIAREKIDDVREGIWRRAERIVSGMTEPTDQYSSGDDARIIDHDSVNDHGGSQTASAQLGRAARLFRRYMNAAG